MHNAAVALRDRGNTRKGAVFGRFERTAGTSHHGESSMPQAAKASNGRKNPDAVASGDIRDLFSFQLQRLAGLSTRIAALSIRPKFGVTAREWRAIAVLSYLGEAPLQELARQSGLLKSQMSRTVSGLIDRGLIRRNANPEDGRSILLRLTPAGEKLAHAILADSRTRNIKMLEGLSAAERQLLIELVQRVFSTSLHYFGEIKKSVSQSDLKRLNDDEA